MFLFSSLFIIQEFFVCIFLWGGGQSIQGLCWFTLGWLWEYHMMLICSLVGLLHVSQAGLELASGGTRGLLFYQYNVVYRTFVQAGVQGVKV
jgi:hypothetical protein